MTAYRQAMADFAQMGTMDVWYAHLDEDEIMTSLRSTLSAAEHHLAGVGRARAAGVRARLTAEGVNNIG